MARSKVIEILSSDEDSGHAGVLSPRRTRSKKRHAPPSKATEVIELTDSDDEVLVLLDPRSRKAPKRAKAPKAKSPEAGSSRARTEAPLPLFFPDPEDEASPSSRGGSKQAVAHQPTEPAEPDRPRAPAVLPALAPAAAGEPDRSMPVPASELGPLVVAPQDPYDAYVAQVLEIIPDVQPEHVHALVEKHFPSVVDGVVETVLHVLFEDASYPKIDRKGKGKAKRKREDEDDAEERARASAKVKVDYGSRARERPSGEFYSTLAQDQFATDFPEIPVAHVRRVFLRHNMLYAPTHVYLVEERKGANLPYKRKAVRARGGKGKGVAQVDLDLEREKEWVKEKLQEAVAQQDAQVTKQLNEDEGDGIECGCCFSAYPFHKMIQCPEAHLFCMDCMTSYSETLLGSHDANIVCMDQDGCKMPFPESELRRFLSPKLLALYERVKQRKDIEAAGLENLAECPFCDYKVVIENPQERLFRCENQECGAVTCRECKKPDHLPKNCKEVEEDKKLNAQHHVEEAMTRALMRNCPKCQKAFVKEMGCNKMMCPNCHTMSCYACRQIITGYEHFNNPPPYNGKPDPTKCPLWDSVEQRHSEEVAAAAKKALEEYMRAHPELNEVDIKVDLPPPPPNPALPAGAMPIPNRPAAVVLNRAQLDARAELARHHERQQQALLLQQRVVAAQQQAARAAAAYNINLHFHHNVAPVALQVPAPLPAYVAPLPPPVPAALPAQLPRVVRVATRRASRRRMVM